MANDTTLTIVGNLTDEPDLRYTSKGVAVARFTVASTPRVYHRASGTYRDGEAVFMLCNAWRELAENVAESLAKGTRVIVTGRLTQSVWQTKAGEKRTGYTLQAEEIGPSLRFATAVITRTGRRDSSTPTAPAA